MKVRELIEALQACDPEATVITSDCCYGWEFEPKATTKRLYREVAAPPYEEGSWHELEDWIEEERAKGVDMGWLYDEPIEILTVVEVD